MKRIGYCFIITCLLIAGCAKNEYEPTNGGNFWLKMGDGSIVSTSDIDYYVGSTHTIYLKKEVPYFKEMGYNHRTMAVYVGNDKIYDCELHSSLSSLIPVGTTVYPSFFGGTDIIRLNFQPSFYPDSKLTDPRSDRRIITALKKDRLYHEGLYCEIQSVSGSNGKLVLNIELSNPDSFDYYYLDPGKMGIGLFHYFTNGPYIWGDPYTKTFTHQETVVEPVPWDSWKKEWLSRIKSGERKKISIIYQHFDKIPAGSYRMSFSFPGLYKVEQKDRKIGSGRIWMDDIRIEKVITIK